MLDLLLTHDAHSNESQMIMMKHNLCILGLLINIKKNVGYVLTLKTLVYLVYVRSLNDIFDSRVNIFLDPDGNKKGQINLKKKPRGYI